MKVAFIDDRENDIQILEGYLERYIKEKNENITVYLFLSSIEFLEQYHNDFDIIFLDIEMPGEDGLHVAREIRKKDTAVVILFVTNMIQYAICGYEVNALDFMVKPVEFFDFTVKLEKAINIVKRKKKQTLVIGKGDELQRVNIYDIMYVEKEKNNLVFHTVKEILYKRGSIADLKKYLEGAHFSECMSGCIVNLEYVDLIHKDSILIRGNTLPISRRMKKKFIQDYLEYAGEYI